MSRSKNAELAVKLFDALCHERNWGPSEIWKAFAVLLLTCKIWNGKWTDFHDCVVYRERNDFKIKNDRPNAVLRKAQKLTQFLASELAVDPSDLCGQIGQYWAIPQISTLQPHNLVGNAFRSLVAHVLQKYSDSDISISEEVDPYAEFHGQKFATRSERPRIDIVARRNDVTVALISVRWRYRHDRVDLIDEALAYVTPARRHNPNCKLYAVVGEFSPSRLLKILANAPPLAPHGALSACVHFAPELITNGLGEDGRLRHLKSLEWLINETATWH